MIKSIKGTDYARAHGICWYIEPKHYLRNGPGFQMNPDVGITEDGLCPVVNFDYDYDLGTKSEAMVPMAEMSSALMRILDWLAASRDFRFSGAKVHMLRTLLDPVNGEFRNMSEIAASAQISRATLSKAFMDLRDAYGIHLIGGKLPKSRASYREAQLKLVAAGRHASQVKKDNARTFVPHGT